MKKKCAFKGCQKLTRKRDWCDTHYNKWRWQHLLNKLCLIDGCMEIHDFRRRNAKKVCSKAGCGEPNKVNGFCRKHNQTWWKQHRSKRPRCLIDGCMKIHDFRKVCSKKGCEALTVNWFCHSHNERWRDQHQGSSRYPPRCLIPGCMEIHDFRRRRKRTRCTVHEDGKRCPNPAKVTGGLCAKHYSRVRKHGDPLIVINQDQGKDSGHPHHNRWNMMMQRCYNPDAQNYHHYGGRGITVHPKWHDFLKFRDYLEKMLGPRPEGWSLDRIDCDGNYEPGNVRWASAKEQRLNQRKHVKVGGDWGDPDSFFDCSVCGQRFKSIATFDRHRHEPEEAA